MQQTTQILQFDQVSIGFGERSILESMSFKVHLGEFVYIVGKTGSGKSTLLKMIYADLMPTRGNIMVAEMVTSSLSVEQIPYLRRKIGIVFQDFQLLPDRDVFENVAFALRACGWKEEEKIKKRVTELLLKVGMSHKAAAMPHQLSGGEQQRVVIARALINDPLLLIADEPTGNLDPDTTDEIMALLQKINIGGTAILMVTHEHLLLKKFPARAFHISGKQVVEYRRSQDLLKELYG